MKRILVALALALAAATSFGTTLVPVSLLNPAGSVAGQTIVSTGPTTAPVYGGVGVNGIAAIAANTVLANATGSTAAPTAFAMPSCSTSVSALNWTTSTGFTCNTGLITAATAASTYATITQATTALAATGGSINGVTLGLTTPAAGKVTTLVATSTITPSSTAGIVGTVTNDNAQAGSVGAMPTPTNLTSVAITAFTVANTSSVSLPAGDYWIQAVTQFVPTSTTVMISVTVGVSPTSASIAPLGTYTIATCNATANIGNVVIASPMTRVKLATTTTIYNVSTANFNTSTLAASGYLLISNAR